MSISPNIVFVLTDDQGYPPLGAHGHPFVQTPNLDTFHKNAVRFDQFHTGTTCAPTRAGLLTGHHCNSTGVWHTVGGYSLMRRDEWTLADALRENGYKTGLFGKWHLGDAYPYRPHDRGFDKAIYHGGGGISQIHDWWGNDYFDDTYLDNGSPKEFKGYCTDVFFDEALDFIEKNAQSPFFCFLSTNAPHSPYNVPPEYRDMYTHKTESDNYARFLGMITNIDDNFGRLQQKLDELNLTDNTIVVFMSDNGQCSGAVNAAPDAYNAEMRGLKASPYDGGHRVPFLLSWPGGELPEGYTVSNLTSYIDFMPTILDLCGVDTSNRHFHGDSLLPLIKGDQSTYWKERTTVTDTQRTPLPIKWFRSCVMQDTWRLVNRDELYNIADDPSQENNIASLHPDRVAVLRDAYEKWWQICEQQMANTNTLSIGSHTQTECVLRSHDLTNEQDTSIAWNQLLVRKGYVCRGYWKVQVEEDGEYEFTLRRWPEEAGHKICSGIDPEEDITYYAEGISPNSIELYKGSVALDLDGAILDITGQPQQYKDVTENDSQITFRTHLTSGLVHIRARFICKTGKQMAVYYVTAKRITI